MRVCKMSKVNKIIAKRNRLKADRIMKSGMNYRMRLAALTTAGISSSEKHWN